MRIASSGQAAAPARAFLVTGSDFTFLEDGVTVVVDRKEFRGNRIALRMSDAPAPIEPNPHRDVLSGSNS